jgi:hypothetical protein
LSSHHCRVEKVMITTGKNAIVANIMLVITGSVVCPNQP